ncbi:MAG: F0F1 ATP synthase subunit epsilon [Devosia sp.]
MSMHLKILLPFGLFADVEAVLRIVVMTTDGSLGLLPRRLDCAAALAPGIVEYQTEAGGVVYAALDEGVMIKTGSDVFISVRRAIAGADLDHLHALVAREFLAQSSEQQSARDALAKLESGFLSRFSELHHE